MFTDPWGLKEQQRDPGNGKIIIQPSSPLEPGKYADEESPVSSAFMNAMNTPVYQSQAVRETVNIGIQNLQKQNEQKIRSQISKPKPIVPQDNNNFSINTPAAGGVTLESAILSTGTAIAKFAGRFLGVELVYELWQFAFGPGFRAYDFDANRVSYDQVSFNLTLTLATVGIASSRFAGASSTSFGEGLFVQSSTNNFTIPKSPLFAQKTCRYEFSTYGKELYTGLADSPINTIDDLTNAINNGLISPSNIPIDIIIRDNNMLLLNTRSSQALINAGIPLSEWTLVDQTGVSFYERALSTQLTKNGLTSSGVSTIKITGVKK